MDKPEWLTESMLAYLWGLHDGSGLCNAGHVSPTVRLGLLMIRYGLSEDQARTAAQYWRWYGENTTALAGETTIHAE